MKFFLHTQIGIENITEVELRDKFKGMYSVDYVGYIPHKNGTVQLDWKDENRLDFYNELHSIEDAYYLLEYVTDIDYEFDLKRIYKSLEANKIKQNLDYFFDKLNPFDTSKKFRLVVRKKAGHDFRRIDLENTIGEYFNKNIPRAEIVKEEGVKEIWVTLVKNRLIIGVRLTDKSKRHAYYKSQSINGSLRSTVAYSMAYLAEFTSSNSLWLPFCGAGTIGCEISEHFKFKKLMLTDVDPEAINVSQENFQNLNSYKQNKGKITFKVEDFFQSKNYADVLIANLPFGVKFTLEVDFFKKFFNKVEEIKGLNKIILLNPDILVHKSWQLTRKFEIEVLGRKAYILVYKRV